jgi:anti-sigma factor ChrR (cupin superfamily)
MRTACRESRASASALARTALVQRHAHSNQIGEFSDLFAVRVLLSAEL